MLLENARAIGLLCSVRNSQKKSYNPLLAAAAFRGTSGVKRKIKDLPNLGQFMSKKLAEIGITNEDELRKIGAVQAYVRLKFLFGREITLNALWAMDATLSAIDWRFLSEERKQELLAQLPKLGR
jgi:TfoX C-terminal domain